MRILRGVSARYAFEAGMQSLAELARRTNLDRAGISRAEAGRFLPSDVVVEAIDTAVGAGGELVQLRARIHRARHGIGEPDGGEVSSTDRREVFELTAAGILAADAYRQWSATGPDPLTVAEIEDKVDQHAAVFTTTAHDALAPKVFDTWRQAEGRLRDATRLRAHRRLTVAAGFCAYMLCRLAFNMGDTITSRRFLTLAENHAEDAEEPVLAASVAGMASTMAFYGGRYEDAVRVAAEAAQRFPHPYTAARLAAYEARARAATDDARSARDALYRMRQTVVDLPARPGMSSFGPAAAGMFAGGVLARMGAGDEAEPMARAAVALYDSGHGGFEERGHALLALAAALLTRESPEPEEAAVRTLAVVALLDGCLTSTVAANLRRTMTQLHPYRELAPVRDLEDALSARSHLVLTAGSAP